MQWNFINNPRWECFLNDAFTIFGMHDASDTFFNMRLKQGVPVQIRSIPNTQPLPFNATPKGRIDPIFPKYILQIRIKPAKFREKHARVFYKIKIIPTPKMIINQVMEMTHGRKCMKKRPLKCVKRAISHLMHNQIVPAKIWKRCTNVYEAVRIKWKSMNRHSRNLDGI